MYIADGRKFFYQWDADREMIVTDPDITELHFCNGRSECSLVCEVKNGRVCVPNILLQTAGNIRIYGFAEDHTEVAKIYKIFPRTKPEDYVYTETEVKRYETLAQEVEGLKKAVEELSAGDDEKCITNVVDGSAKGSLRGTYSMAENPDYIIGVGAVTLGTGTKASGNSAFAIGSSTQATGGQAVATGGGTVASGSGSMATGGGTTASGNNSFSTGSGSRASGNSAVATGGGTTASGDNSFAAGSGTTASGSSSVSAGLGTKATGNAAIATGMASFASGDFSHAEGNRAHAVNTGSHAEGYFAPSTTVVLTGDANATTYTCSSVPCEPGHVYFLYNGIAARCVSIEEYNQDTKRYTIKLDRTLSNTAMTNVSVTLLNEGALGAYSHAEGYRTVAAGDHQHASGRLNALTPDKALVIGNGTDNGGAVTRSNAHTLDWDGNAWYAGTVEGRGLILSSPDGTRYQATVADDGSASLDNDGSFVDNVARQQVADLKAIGGGLPDGGAPHQMLVTDANGVTQWEDKLCYETFEDVVFLQEQTFELDDSGMGGISAFAVTPMAGDTCTVTWNGTDYSCTVTAQTADGIDCATIGNASVFGGEASDEPFAILIVPDELVEVLGAAAQIFALDGSQLVTLSISGKQSVVKKIDPKFFEIKGETVFLDVGIDQNFTQLSRNYSRSMLVALLDAGKNIILRVRIANSDSYLYMPVKAVENDQIIFECVPSDGVPLTVRFYDDANSSVTHFLDRILLRAPNGTFYSVLVNNDGTLTTSPS